MLFPVLCTGCRTGKDKEITYGTINLIEKSTLLSEVLKECEDLPGYSDKAEAYDDLYSYAAGNVEFKRLIRKRIEYLQSENEYSIYSPMFIFNPYQDTEGILYVYFGDGNIDEPVYAVIEDNKGNTWNTYFYHEILKKEFEGIIPGIFEGNIKTIQFTFNDISVTYDFSALSLQGSENGNEGKYEEDMAYIAENTDVQNLSAPGYIYGFNSIKGKYVFYDKNGRYAAGLYVKKGTNGKMFVNTGSGILYEDSRDSLIFVKNTGEVLWQGDLELTISAYNYSSNENFLVFTGCNESETMMYGIETASDRINMYKISSFDENSKMLYVRNEYTAMENKKVHICGSNTFMLYGTEGRIFSLKGTKTGMIARWQADLKEMSKAKRDMDIIVKLDIINQASAGSGNTDNIAAFNDDIRIFDIIENEKNGKQYLSILAAEDNVPEIITGYCDNIRNELIITDKRIIAEESREIAYASFYGSNIIVHYKNGEISEFDKSGSKLYIAGAEGNTNIYGKINMSRIFE